MNKALLYVLILFTGCSTSASTIEEPVTQVPLYYGNEVVVNNEFYRVTSGTVIGKIKDERKYCVRIDEGPLKGFKEWFWRWDLSRRNLQTDEMREKRGKYNE